MPSLARLFLCGDVMTGRGIDQVLSHPSNPRLYEPWVRDARDYVELAERANGPIPAPVDWEYVWGDALAVLDSWSPDARIINLETAVTDSEDAWPGKGINYRMHPANIPCLTAAGVDICALANNHVLDWGYQGLEQTRAVLLDAGIRSAGAGRDLDEAREPAVVETSAGGRVVVFSLGHASSGVPVQWAATAERPGVDLLADLSARSAAEVSKRIAAVTHAGDIVVASIHWGGNWGYSIPAAQRQFAHGLIDGGAVDIVHGHSSHHPKGIEVYRGRLILYGSGDLLADYEGIGGYESYRGDLPLMYLVLVDVGTGQLEALDMVPLRLRRFRLQHASPEEIEWLVGRFDLEGRHFGTRVESGDGTLCLRWL